MTTEFKEALEKLKYSSAFIADRETIRRALHIADRLMQEPSRAMEEIGSGQGTPRQTGWKKPLRPGMRVACTKFDEYERAANCFKAMRDELLREVDEDIKKESKDA